MIMHEKTLYGHYRKDIGANVYITISIKIFCKGPEDVASMNVLVSSRGTILMSTDCEGPDIWHSSVYQKDVVLFLSDI